MKKVSRSRRGPPTESQTILTSLFNLCTKLLTKAKVAAGDTVIVSELSRLGRSLREVLGLIEELIHQKRCRLILVKQGLDLDPQNHRDMTHKILLTIFAMLAEL